MCASVLRDYKALKLCREPDREGDRGWPQEGRGNGGHAEPYPGPSRGWQPQGSNHMGPSDPPWPAWVEQPGDARGQCNAGAGPSEQAAGPPWWHRLENFVPVAALRHGRDPRLASSILMKVSDPCMVQAAVRCQYFLVPCSMSLS